MKHPPEPETHGLMHDNCGNIVCWMRPNVVDDLLSELEAGSPEIAISVLRELQSAALNHRPDEPNTETRPSIEEIS